MIIALPTGLSAGADRDRARHCSSLLPAAANVSDAASPCTCAGV